MSDARHACAAMESFEVVAEVVWLCEEWTLYGSGDELGEVVLFCPWCGELLTSPPKNP